MHHLRKMHFAVHASSQTTSKMYDPLTFFEGAMRNPLPCRNFSGLSGRARMFPSSAGKLREDAITCSNVPCIDFIEVVYPVPIWYGFCHDAWKHVIAQVCHLVLRIYKFFAILHQKVSLSMSYIARNIAYKTGDGGRIAATWKK